MTEDPGPGKLEALEKRIEAAKAAKGNRAGGAPKSGLGFSQGEVAWRMVIELVSGMVLGLAIGYGLDVLFGTLPIFLVIFSLLGFGAGVRVMMGTAREMAKTATAADAPAPDAAADERD
jgi:ATP synthase protein I